MARFPDSTAAKPARGGRRLRGALLCAATAILLATPAAAGRADISDRLKARATRVCRGDALRFCPGQIFSRVAVVRCLSTKRPKLTPACQRAYDDVARALRR